MRLNWYDRVCFAPADDPPAPPPADPPAPPPADPPPGDPTTLDKLLSSDTYASIKDKGYRTFDDFAKGFLNLETKIGAARTVLPTAESSPEAWEAFWKEAGRPEDGDKYELALREGQTKDDGLDKFFRDTSLKIGLNQNQAGTFFNSWSEFQEARAKAVQEATEKVMDGLKSEWGSKFDAKVDAGKAAIGTGAGEDAATVMHLKLADGSYLMDNPFVARMMSSLGEKLGEAGRDPADIIIASGITTPAAAKAEVARLTADPEFAKVFTTRGHPEHQAAVDKMRGLHVLANQAK